MHLKLSRSESHCCLFPSEIGESLNQLLNGLEDFGLDELPAELEIDLRQVMELSTPEDMSLMLQHQADGGGSDLLLEEAADLFSDTESVAAFMRMGMISPIAAYVSVGVVDVSDPIRSNLSRSLEFNNLSLNVVSW